MFKKILLPLLLVILVSPILTAQSGNIGIGTTTPDSSALLDLSSTDKGLLLPRLTTAERDAISNPAPGLLIYNTTDSCFNYYTGSNWYKDCGRSLSADVEPLLAATGGGSGYDKGQGIATDASGNVYVTGFFQDSADFGDTTLTSSGGYDVFVVKYDASGVVQWAVQGGGTSYEESKGIATDASGNVYVTGYFQGTADFGDTTLTSMGGYDVFVVKYDASGIVQWAVQGGGSGEEAGQDIATDASGNVYITGYYWGTADFGDTTLTNSGANDVFVVKYDATGVVQWAAKAGDSGDELGQGIATDASGNVYVTGYFYGTTDFGDTTLTNSGSFDVFVVKYDASGIVQWALQGGGTSFDKSEGVATDASGNVYVTGYFQGTADFGDTTLTSSGSSDVFVVKYDASGIVQWAAQGGGTSSDESKGIATDASGDIYVTGFFYGTADFGSTTLTSSGFSDVFVVKYNASGIVQWAVQGGGASSDESESIATDVSGDVYATGYFQGTADFGSATLVSSGFWEVFVVQYNSSGGQTQPVSSLSASQDNDSDPTNEHITDMVLNGTTLEITDAGGTSSVDLGPLTATMMDADGDTKIQVEETADEDVIRFDLGGTEHFVMDGPRLEVKNSGQSVFIGNGAGANDDLTNNYSVAIGDSALYSNTTYFHNTAVGHRALYSNAGPYAYQNTAIGSSALVKNISGSDNTATGMNALSYNTSGSFNVASGSWALDGNTTGSYNTAIGYSADVLTNNLTKAIAIGYKAKVGCSNCMALGGTGLDAVNVGIGTANPLSKFHLKDGAILVQGTTGATPVSGAGTRLMWIPGKTAFRAGNVTGTHWDDSNIGQYSFVGGGVNNKATGLDAFVAGGYNNTASGYESFIGGGDGLLAESFTEAVFGSFNTDYNPLSTTAWNSDDRVFVIGNGSNVDNRSNAVTVLKSGYVGIGTDSPVAPLHVTGASAVGAPANIKFFSYNFTSIQTVNNWEGQTAIYAEGNICADEAFISSNNFNFSDARIKQIIGRSNGKEDLDRLNRIEVTRYTHLDTISKSSAVQTKVIAQQLEEVMPEAVSRTQQYIPNVMQIAVSLTFDPATQELLVEMKQPHSLAVGDRLKCIEGIGSELHVEVLSVPDNQSIVFKTAHQPEQLFVYGKEVDDFRIVDYDAIAMLNVSATQELHQIITSQAAHIAQLEEKLKAMEDLEKRLNRIEATMRMNSPVQPPNVGK